MLMHTLIYVHTGISHVGITYILTYEVPAGLIFIVM